MLCFSNVVSCFFFFFFENKIFFFLLEPAVWFTTALSPPRTSSPGFPDTRLTRGKGPGFWFCSHKRAANHTATPCFLCHSSEARAELCTVSPKSLSVALAMAVWAGSCLHSPWRGSGHCQHPATLRWGQRWIEGAWGHRPAPPASSFQLL